MPVLDITSRELCQDDTSLRMTCASAVHCRPGGSLPPVEQKLPPPPLQQHLLPFPPGINIASVSTKYGIGTNFWYQHSLRQHRTYLR
eukprot:2386846-Rhodomonas_salina.1